MAAIARLALSRILAQSNVRTFRTTSRVQTEMQTWQQYGVPGSTLPFRLDNRYRLTGYFMLFFGVPFNLPFFVVIHHLRKE